MQSSRAFKHSALVIGAFTVIFGWVYGRALLGDVYLAESDLYEYFLPLFLAKFSTWSAFEFAGIPIFSDPGESFAYPVFAFFSKILGSWTWFVISAHVLAACGTYAYVYTLTRNKAAAFVAGLAFGLSEAMLERLAHMTTLHTLAWLPFALLCLERFRVSVRRYWAGMSALAIACVILAGHPQPAIYTCITAGAYALIGGICERKQRSYYAAIAGIFVLAGMLAAVKLLPFAEVTRHMARDTMSFGQFIARGNSGPLLWTVLFPTVLHDGREAPSYVGLAVLMLAFVGATFWRRDWRIAFWVVTLSICVLFGIGEDSPIARFAFDYLPTYNKFRVGARHLMIASFAAAILAGFGVGWICSDARARIRVLVGGALLMLGVVLGIAYLGHPHPGLEFEIRDPIQWTRIGFPAVMADTLWTQTLLAVATTAAIAGMTFARRRGPWIAAIGIVLVADLLNAQPFGLSPIGIRSVMMPRSAAAPSVHAEAIGADLLPHHQRALALGGTARDAVLPAAWARIWQIPIAGSYGPMLLQRHSELSTMGRNGAVRTNVLSSSDQSLDLLAVRTLLVQPSDVASSGTVEIGGVTWDSQPLDLPIGRADCGYPFARSATIALPPDIEVSAVHVLAYLRCSEDVKQGVEVGRFSVVAVDDQRVTQPLHAGVEMTDASLGDPSVRARAGHQPGANVVQPAGSSGMQSLVTIHLPTPTRVTRLEINAAGLGGWLVVDRVAITNREGQSVSRPPAQTWLDDRSRWREVRRFRTSRYTDRGVDRDVEGEQDYSVFENRRALPRAFVVPRVETVKLSDVTATIRSSQLPDGRAFDASRMAVVAAEDGGPPPQSFADGESKVDISAVDNGHITLRVSGPGGFLVLSETYYPGWKATIDGTATDVYRADLSLQGIVVPGGTHEVVFRFAPTTLLVGALVSVFGLCGVAALLWRRDDVRIMDGQNANTR